MHMSSREMGCRGRTYGGGGRVAELPEKALLVSCMHLYEFADDLQWLLGLETSSNRATSRQLTLLVEISGQQDVLDPTEARATHLAPEHPRKPRNRLFKTPQPACKSKRAS